MPKTACFTVPPLAAILGTLVLLGLPACATTQAPVDSPLNGQWRLDPAASDNVNAKIAAAISSAQKKLRDRRRYLARRTGVDGNGGPNGGNSGAGGPASGSDASGAGGADSPSGEDESFDSPGDIFGNGGSIGPDFRQLREHLLQALGAPSVLVLKVQPDVVDIQHDALPAREYRAGEVITRFDEYGTARLDSKWSGGAFTLRQRYTNGARLIERFEVDSSGALVYTRSLADPTIGKLEIKSVYRRA